MSAIYTTYSEMSHALLVKEALRLRARVAELKADNQLHAQRLADSHAIVARIWALFGNPRYADLKGKSIYDLITDLQDQNAKLKAELAAARSDLEWARNPGQNGF